MTSAFWYILLWSVFFEALVLGICVPIIVAVYNHTKPRRELKRVQAVINRDVFHYCDESRVLLDEIYSDIKTGVVVAPPEIEQRVLDVCSLAGDIEDVILERKAIR